MIGCFKKNLFLVKSLGEGICEILLIYEGENPKICNHATDQNFSDRWTGKCPLATTTLACDLSIVAEIVCLCVAAINTVNVNICMYFNKIYHKEGYKDDRHVCLDDHDDMHQIALFQLREIKCVLFFKPGPNSL